MEPGRDQLRLTVIVPIAEAVDPPASLYLTLPADYAPINEQAASIGKGRRSPISVAHLLCFSLLPCQPA